MPRVISFVRNNLRELHWLFNWRGEEALGMKFQMPSADQSRLFSCFVFFVWAAAVLKDLHFYFASTGLCSTFVCENAPMAVDYDVLLNKVLCLKE